MKKLSCFLLIILMVFPVHANKIFGSKKEQLYNGLQVLSICQYQKKKCDRYFLDIMDVLDAFKLVGGDEATTCVPDNVKLEAFRDLGVGFLQANPDIQKYTAIAHLSGFYAKTFPCT